MNQQLVSVIIPSYERAVFLRTRSIPSVLNQTYPHWELIVVGDGPVDSSIRQAVESFSDSRIKYVEISRPDYSKLTDKQFWYVAGAEARNYGLSLASGEVIAPLDDDDEFLPKHLEDAVIAIKDDGYDLFYGSVIVRDLESGVDYDDYFPWDYLPNHKKFSERNIMFHSSVCYHKRFLNLKYPTNGEEPADYALWKAIQKQGGRFTSTARSQAIYYGSKLSNQIRVTCPKLPNFDVLAPKIKSILQSRQVSNWGSFSQSFEQKIAQTVESRYCLTVPSGDIAMIMALRCIRLLYPSKSRLEVIVPSYTFPSTVNAILWNGLSPVFADINLSTLCLDPRKVEPLINKNTAAIVPVHAHGNPGDTSAINILASESGTPLVWDAAPALGASIYNQKIGSISGLEVFSFSGTKTITTGEGGAICFSDPNFMSELKTIRNYGIGEEYTCETLGLNGKMSELSAAMGLGMIDEVNAIVSEKNKLALVYKEALMHLPDLRFQELTHQSSIPAMKDMVLICEDINQASLIRMKLHAYGIQSRPYYRPLHRMPAFSGLKCGHLQNTEQIADCIVCIPFYLGIRTEVMDLVIEVVKEAVS